MKIRFREGTDIHKFFLSVRNSGSLFKFDKTACMKIRSATITDIPEITAIYNDALVNTTATFDTEEKNVEDRMRWFEQHGEKYPVIVAVEKDQVVGWASLSRWSDKCAYDDTAEISIYVHHDFRGQGIGKLLLQEVMEYGRKGGLHCVLSRITSGNDASIHMHELAGFEHAGILKEVGRKFDRLLDVYMMQFIYR